MKPIEDYTADELSAKIEAIKAERERTANALKRYEEELERRKQEAPLGVPIGGAISRSFLLWFQSEESADKFDKEYFTNFIRALRDIANGNAIDIQTLLPLLKKGYVAMDENGDWFWYENQPRLEKSSWMTVGWDYYRLSRFNLKPAKNWKTSLLECGL